MVRMSLLASLQTAVLGSPAAAARRQGPPLAVADAVARRSVAACTAASPSAVAMAGSRGRNVAAMATPSTSSSGAKLRAASYLQQDLTDAEIESLVYDSIIWANQHGMVRCVRAPARVEPRQRQQAA